MHVRGSWGFAEMPLLLLALAGTRKHDSATALGGAQGQLGRSKDLVPGFEDAAPGVTAYMKCTHLQFGHLLNTHVIGYSLYNHSSFGLTARKLHVPDHPGKGQRWPVGVTHEQHLRHHLGLVHLATNLYCLTNSLR